MKFIYCMNTSLKEDLINAGLKLVTEVMINGVKISVFANSKEVFLNKYQKNEIVLSNRLFFDVNTSKEK
jgi:hypothetical protein